VLARSARGSIAVILASVGLVGCGGSSGSVGGSAGRVRDFAAVEVGQTQLQVAPDGRSAVLRVHTDPPTVCAVAYGRTASLGLIANDPSMGGTAITRHIVELRDLTPNTTYRYRLTATDAEGSVFQTRRLESFRTNPSKASNAARPDIAVGAKVVAVSSQYGSGYGAANAVDGNLATEWSSAGDGDRAYITIDLGAERKISGVAFVTRGMSDGSAITRTFAVVVDGSRRYGPFPAGTRANLQVAKVSFTGRRLRFEVVTSTGGNTGAAEIEVFAG